MAFDPSKPVSIQNPYVIANPFIGFLNLAGTGADALMAADQQNLSPLFPDRVNLAAPQQVPRCHVLFFYGALEPSSRVAGYQFTLRQLLKATGARIAVVASEVPPDVVMGREFSAAQNDWPANLVITLNRNGEHFGSFFRKLFTRMYAGVTMPMAWVELAPQGPTQPKDIPGTICLMEVGHIAFANAPT